MKTTCDKPFKVGPYPTTSKYGRFRPDGTGFNEVSSDVVFSEMRSYLEAALARDANKELTVSRPSGHFGPFHCKYTGTPKPKIPTKYIPLESLRQNNGKAWREAARTGNIVMSDFKTGMVELNYTFGSDVVKPGEEVFFVLNAANEGLFPLHQGMCVINGWVYLGAPFRLYFNRGREEIEGKSPYEEGWSDTRILNDLNSKINGLEVDGEMVTSCLAEANSGTLDALTALAEAPETLKSALEAAKSGLKLYKEARQKAFRLYNKAKGKSNKETLKKNSKELADALSNVWLNYRYNIMPNIYLIEDVQRTLLAKSSEFVRFRDTKRKSFSVTHPGFKPGGEFSSTDRVLIKRRLDLNGSMPKFDHLVMTNIFVTAWELVPLSFVADWFVNVGDVIASTTFRPGITQEGSTYSWKTSGTMNFVAETTQKSAVSVTIKVYRRDVISPSAHTCLTWRPELNSFRITDALALSWGAFKRTFSK